jgi:acetyltransferase-like isoleucine patch superfamily enzyme
VIIVGIDDFLTKVRKADTPFYKMLKKTAKNIVQFEAPRIPLLHSFLYRERELRIGLWRSFWRAFYYQPMFRTRCKSCGKHLHILHSGQGIPLIIGNLDIEVGNNVVIYDRISLAGLITGDNPVLRIGDNSQVHSSISIYVANEVSIGSNCLIVSTLITDNPGHNIDYRTRLTEPVEIGAAGRVIIGDYVWAARSSMIIGDVRIGTGAIIAARAVVTKDIPPFCVVAGNPARIVKKLPFPEEMIEKIGQDEYQKYLDAEVR